MNKKIVGIILAILAAVFYAINTPFSKMLLNDISPTMLASFLYLGAGLGISIIYLFLPEKKKKEEKKLTKNDFIYVILMVVLDIAAPIFLMVGLNYSNASSVSLLNNFEIVATSLIAFIIFKEKISPKMRFAIVLITISGFILSIGDFSNFEFNIGSLFVLLASLCWGFENNCTKKISDKSTYQIVIIKGLFSGIGSMIIAFIIGETLPKIQFIIYALLLGFVAYGLSIFVYIRAQKEIGATKTSSFYAIAPFIGTFLSLIILNENIHYTYFIALAIMIIATIFIILDTLLKHHKHIHKHVITHTHDGYTHNHVIEHSHFHWHNENDEIHIHKHLKNIHHHHDVQNQ